MQMQCASSLTDGILLFNSAINYQKWDVTYSYNYLARVCDIFIQLLAKLSARVKGKMYKSVVRPAMLCGMETVAVTERQVGKMKWHR